MSRARIGLIGGGLACLAVCAVTPVAAAAPARAAAVGTIHVRVHSGRLAMTQSSNWSGYNIGADYPGVSTGTRFTSISGQWVVPTATQHKSGQAEDSASWVGIGGGCVDASCTVTDSTLIQAGTEQDVAANGKASYDAWWEIIPEPETTTSLPVKPGNLVRVTISQTAPEVWSILIKNVTTGKSFSTSTPYSSSMLTAEWIEETPLEIGTGGTGVAAMPKLGTVHFSAATLNSANPKLTGDERLQLSPSSGVILATPSLPDSARNAFNDCTYATSCAAP